MDQEKKACCARSAGWALVGVAIAVAWGIGNLSNGMSPGEAFAIPGLIVFAIVGVVVLAELDVPWFRKLSLCDRSGPQRREQPNKFARGH